MYYGSTHSIQMNPIEVCSVSIKMLQIAYPLGMMVYITATVETCIISIALQVYKEVFKEINSLEAVQSCLGIIYYVMPITGILSVSIL